MEDDPVQVLDPERRGGANGPSLVESQEVYLREGACETRLVDVVRAPRADDVRHPEWRSLPPFDLGHGRTPRELSDEESVRLETWYSWKPS